MRGFPLVVLGLVFICGIALVSLNLTYMCQPEKSFKAKDQDAISHDLFATPYNENSIPFTNWADSETKTKKAFWLAHKPSYKCPAALLSRVGFGKRKEADGPKWMCGLEAFGQLTDRIRYPCVFYSFGVAGDSSFETEVMLKTTCSVFAYDMTVDKIGKPLSPSNPRVHFQKMGISGENTKKWQTLKTLMDQNGHQFIDILKIDVEGAEYPAFEKIFEDFPDQLPFGQLLIELHNNVQDWTKKGIRTVLDLTEGLEKRGFRLFSVEPNRYYMDHCSEFSFINLNYRRLFIPDKDLS